MEDNWAVDLAPEHKVGLPLRTRVLIAAGMSRAGTSRQIPFDLTGVGAIITGPWTGPAEWSRYPVLVERPGGVLWTPRQPPRGISQALRRLSPQWQRLGVAVIGALGPAEVAPTVTVAQRLGNAAGVAGLLVEVGPDEDVGQMLARVAGAVEACEIPVLAALPVHRAASLAIPALNAGVSALVVGSAPPGAWPRGDGWVEGGVYGPLVLPLMLRALRQVLAIVPTGTPVVAQGGIHSPEEAVMCRQMGAAAVALDTAVWVEPDLPARVWEALQAWEEEQEQERAQEVEEGNASGHPTGK